MWKYLKSSDKVFLRVNTFGKLIRNIIAIILTFFAVFYVAQFGVVAMIFGEHATIAYEIIGNIIQWTTYVFLVILILAIPYLIVSYLVHRGKPDKTSPELAAINALMAEIEALKNELREKDSKRTKKKGNMNNYDDM